MISSGVFNSLSTGFAKVIPKHISAIARHPDIKKAVPTISRTRSVLPAPTPIAVVIPIPTVKPMITTIMMFSTGMVVPMAANGPLPTNRPMMMESAMLYNCWTILPISIGITNAVSSFSGLPCVRSLLAVFAISFYSFDLLIDSCCW